MNTPLLSNRMAPVCCACVLAGVAAVARPAAAAPRVWAIDDGEKIKQDAVTLPFASGTSNPVWSPDQPIRLFSMANETVAVQIVVQADAAPLDGVSVDLPALVGPAGAAIQNDPAATDPTSFVGRPIERFVEHYFDVTRASGGRTSGESLGWASGSGPAPGAWTGLVPDALIPVEAAPSWDPYPMHVDANRNAVVWIDVTVPPGQPPGTYTGAVTVAAGGSAIATLPIELDVVGATLPDRPVQTMLFYDRSELDRRIAGGDAAEQNLWKLYHRHRVSPMHDAVDVAGATRHLPALTGAAFTAASGYDGPGVGKGDGIQSLGAYGALGAPSAGALSNVEAIADVLAQNNVFPTTDVFVYAIDETCGSPFGAQWKSLLAGSSDPNAKNVLVGWTCGQDPRSQPVDVPIVIAGSYDPASASAADAAGKKVWIYNGERPQTDAFFTDTSAIALRANGWIAAMAGIPRWFYWETTFWYDDNPGGHGAYDPFTTPETFHNSGGDWAEGDGVLVYPGKQVDVFTTHSIGMSGVLASIRLKNLRRGIEDAGYYQLAHAADPARAEAIAAGLLPRILSAASDGSAVSWTEQGDAWFQARKALLGLVPQRAAVPAAGGDGGARGAGGGGAGGASNPNGASPIDASAPATGAPVSSSLVEAGAGAAPAGASAMSGAGGSPLKSAAAGCACSTHDRGPGTAAAALVAALALVWAAVGRWLGRPRSGRERRGGDVDLAS